MLWLLILGVLLYSLVHLFPCVMPARRVELLDSMGRKYQGIFALTILSSIVLMVIGWRNTVPTPVYTPPEWGRHLTMLLMLISIVLFGASNARTRLKRLIRNPMLSGMIVWGVAHLLANGDIRSVVLFGGLTVWAIVSIYFTNRRDGTWTRPGSSVTWLDEVKLIGVSAVIYVVLIFLHPYFTGVSIVPH
jgi:uncharacterized membrane protein